MTDVDLVNKYEITIRELLKDLGIVDDEVLQNTPKRWIRFLQSYSKPLKTEFNDFKQFETDYDEIVVVETEFWSICEHHLLPYFGKAFIGYIPEKSVLGVSKVVRFVQYISKKPSIQESLTFEIADELFKKTKSKGLIILMKGFHTCVASRYSNGWMTTSTKFGLFRTDPSLVANFNKIINNKPLEVID